MATKESSTPTAKEAFNPESVFEMKKGTEFPESFAGTKIRFLVIAQPKDENDWAGFTEAVRGSVDNALTAHAVYVSSQRLEIQKDIKAEANTEGMTAERLQALALDKGEGGLAIIRNKRLRGTSGGTKKVTGKQKAKIEKQVYASILDDPNTPPEVRAFMEQRQKALEALGVDPATATEAATEAVNGGAAKPKAAKK
jgi:hypothetical protein